MSIYRIQRKSPIASESATTETKVKVYLDRVIKLIPADVIAGYLTVRGFWLPKNSTEIIDITAQCVLNWWLPIAGFIATFILRLLGTSMNFAKFNDIQWGTIISTCIAYFIWVFSIQTSVFNLQLDPRIAPSFLVLFTLFIPAFTKGSLT